MPNVLLQMQNKIELRPGISHLSLKSECVCEHLMSCLLFAFTFLTGCSQAQGNNQVYEPEVNPKPEFFLLINVIGTNKIQTQWLVTYRSNNPQCQLTTNRLEGVAVDRTRSLIYKLMPNESVNTLKIPLDLFQSGFCEWGLQDIAYSVGELGIVTIAYFDQNTKPQAFTAYSTVECKKTDSRYICSQTSRKDFNANLGIPLANYSYTLKIKASE